MSSRGDDTRRRILDTAEQLFAERGFHAVSLREIRIAAGARNTAAVQFHFGDRDGLTIAIAERHLPRIASRQRELLDRLVADKATSDGRRLVDVLIRPIAEYVGEGPSARAWSKMMGEFSSDPTLRVREIRSFTPEAGREIGARLYSRLGKRMPPEIARERMFMLAQYAVQVCAARALMEEAGTGARDHPPLAVFVENLIDTTHAALFAPVSDRTTAILRSQRRSAGPKTVTKAKAKRTTAAPGGSKSGEPDSAQRRASAGRSTKR